MTDQERREVPHFSNRKTNVSRPAPKPEWDGTKEAIPLHLVDKVTWQQLSKSPSRVLRRQLNAMSTNKQEDFDLNSVTDVEMHKLENIINSRNGIVQSKSGKKIPQKQQTQANPTQRGTQIMPKGNH